MAENRLELYIETLTGTAFELQVTPLETIMSIKAKIQHLEGIPVSQQHLIWRSQELENEFSLQDYCIQDGSTLRLVLGMQGGPVNTRKVDSTSASYLMAELLEGEDVFDGGGGPLTVVLLHDGDKVHWYRVIEESQTPSRNSESEQDMVEAESSPGHILENQLMKQKIEILQRKLRSMGINKKNKRRKPMTPRKTSSPESGFLPPLPNGALVGNMGRIAARGRYKNQESAKIERLPEIEKRKTDSSLSSNSDTPTRRFSLGGNVHRLLPTKKLDVPSRGDSTQGHIECPLKALCVKDLCNFSSVSGTPSTSYRQLADLDKWIQDRPKTTPSSKFIVYCPMEGISAFHGSKGQSHHILQHYQLKNHPIGRSVQNVGSRNNGGSSGKTSPHFGPGSIVAGGINRIRSGGRQRSNTESGKSSNDTERADSATKLPPIKVKKKKRCTWCNKKTGLATSYICRCGKNYCASHRYPELHHCSHDFKSEGRRLLEMNNPLITASKLPKI